MRTWLSRDFFLTKVLATHRQLAHRTVAADTMVEVLRAHIGLEDARQVLASRPISWLQPSSSPDYGFTEHMRTITTIRTIFTIARTQPTRPTVPTRHYPSPVFVTSTAPVGAMITTTRPI